MTLLFTQKAVKQIKKLSSSDQKKVKKRLSLLKKSPLQGKKLKGNLKGLFSYRAWPYRIIYQHKKSTLIIIIIQHRQSAYSS